jgi:hypothetical protein
MFIGCMYKSLTSSIKYVHQYPSASCRTLRLLQSSQNSVVSRLSLVPRVEQQRVTLRPPRVAVAYTPYGDTNAIGLVQARLDNVRPVSSLRVLDVNFSERALGSSSAESSHSGGGVGTLAGGQVTLRADTVDRDTLADPVLDVANHGLGLCVGGLVEVVVLREVS